MDIKTKFNVGDKVFLFDQKSSQVIERVVLDIKISVDSKNKPSIIYGLTQDIKEGSLRGPLRKDVNETPDIMYKTKEDLKNHLKEYIDNL